MVLSSAVPLIKQKTGQKFSPINLGYSQQRAGISCAAIYFLLLLCSCCAPGCVKFKGFLGLTMRFPIRPVTGNKEIQQEAGRGKQTLANRSGRLSRISAEPRHSGGVTAWQLAYEHRHILRTPGLRQGGERSGNPSWPLPQ